MKYLGTNFILIIIYNIIISMFIALNSKHSVIFLDDACIKPYKRYDYLTCDDNHVIIDGDYYTIPKNFKTDLASIPRILWPVLAPQYSGFVAPAILHDWLYSCGNLGTRKWADEVLYSALIQQGVGFYTALEFYATVRFFGASHYKDKNNYCIRTIHGQHHTRVSFSILRGDYINA